MSTSGFRHRGSRGGFGLYTTGAKQVETTIEPPYFGVDFRAERTE
jgi:hypothetical protein